MGEGLQDFHPNFLKASMIPLRSERNSTLLYSSSVVLVVASTLTNLYASVTWIRAFTTFDTQAERVSHFLGKFPFATSVFTLNVILFGLTALSLYLLVKVIKQAYWLPIRFVQLLFAVSYIWQSL